MSGENDVPDWCAQAEWPVVPCLRTCKEFAPHHHHNQDGTRWANPGSKCLGTQVSFRPEQESPMTGLSPERREELVKAMAEHGPSGFVNSKDGWIECLCEARLVCALTSDGYPADEGAEDIAWARHRADALASLIAWWLRVERIEATAEVRTRVEAALNDYPVGAAACRHFIDQRDTAIRAALVEPTKENHTT